jgi:uncharacterized membrane protein
MSQIEESIEVDAPLKTVYNQWTQFESFPYFMDGVQEVRQEGDTRLHWRAEIGGVTREWEAEITEQKPDERVAWRALDGSNGGVVTFHRLDANRTKVMLQIDFDPSGMVETVGDKLGFVKRRASGDLGRFKEFVEARGAASGGWRGTVERSRP